MAYRIEYDPEAEEHLAVLTAKRQANVLDTVLRQLQHQPTVVTGNREPMRPNETASWELRVAGRFRVYYDVNENLEPVVSVRAVGIKDRNRVLIGGKEYEL